MSFNIHKRDAFFFPRTLSAKNLREKNVSFDRIILLARLNPGEKEAGLCACKELSGHVLFSNDVSDVL